MCFGDKQQVISESEGEVNVKDIKDKDKVLTVTADSSKHFTSVVVDGKSVHLDKSQSTCNIQLISSIDVTLDFNYNPLHQE